uniref:Apple domain-containing protein n=1 Tax=Strigamia maritima TaxID=126957 RepID=T1IYR5_STRMM
MAVTFNFVSTNIMLLQLILILPIILVSGRDFGESFPEAFIPKVFQVNIQVTDPKDRETTLRTEYYDGIKQKGSIITWSNKEKSQITFNRLNETHVEYFTVLDDTTCKDENVENNADSVFTNGAFVFSTLYYFTFLPDLLLTPKDDIYMGVTTETYKGEIRLGDEKANLTFIWSVPESNWQFPNCPDIKNCANWAVPMKTILQMADKIELTYVYYDFKTTIEDPEAFQLPRGVACNFPTTTRAFPNNLPRHFEAGVEIYFPYSSLQITAKERIYYNMDRKIIRVDIDLSPDLTGTETIGLGREIWDYNTHVVYKMNVKNGSCTAEQMSQEDVSTGEKKKTSIGILSFVTSENLDLETFYYVGVRLYRSMFCDVWITNLTNTPTEIYLTNETAKNEDGIEQKYSVPVFVNMSSVEAGIELHSLSMNIFNYDLKVPSWSRFDTTSCFIEEQKIRFQIELKGEYTGVIEENPNEFIFQIQTQLASENKVLPNRFQEIMIDNIQAPNEGNTILFTTTLVENPFNAGHIGSNTYDEANNADLYETLAETIFTEKLTFTYTTAGKSYSYKAVSIRNDIVSIRVTSLKDDISESFQELGAAIITKGIDFTTTGISRVECFENCVKSVEFDCKSWSYCKDTGNCILSSILVEHGKEEEFEYKEHTNCEFYTRYFLKDYVINRETATDATGIEIGVTLDPDTEAECAKHCSMDELPFYCEGFDSCFDSTTGKRTCYFRARHILEMDPTTIRKSEVCNHYTRDYLGDFMKFKNRSAAFQDYNVHAAAASDVKDCARMCSTSANVNACKAFEMCSPEGNTDKPRTQCRILDSSKQATKQLSEDPSCDHYTRNNFITDRNKPLNPDDRKTTVSPPVNPAAVLKSKTSYSGGEMFALAIGMILLGLLIGGAVVIGVTKYKVIMV